MKTIPSGSPILIALLIAALTVIVPAAPSAADSNEAPLPPGTFRSITAGASHSCALLDTSDVKCWGGNGRG